MNNKTVLIVDDAYFMRNLLSRTLKEAGYQIIGEAKNGREGIKLFFELNPDIVTMDINMPDISGIEVTKQILSKAPDAMIIAVTGNNDELIKEEILKAGAREYLQKPFQPAFLWNKLEKMQDSVEDIEVTESMTEPEPIVLESHQEEEIEIEIEILDKPDESKMLTLVIENEEDVIEFPEDFQETLLVESEEYSLSKEKVEAKEVEDFLSEFEEDGSILDNETSGMDDVELVVTPYSSSKMEESVEVIPVAPAVSVEIQVEPEIPYYEIRQPVKEDLVHSPIRPPIKQVVPQQETQPEIPPSRKPKAENTSGEQTISQPNGQSHLEVTKIKGANKNLEEITISPQVNNLPTTSAQNSQKEINIRPPRGKALREESIDRLDSDDIEEPILNVSDEDIYNKQNDGLFKSLKKLFKK